MPPLEQMDRHQDMVLWELSGRGRYAEPTVIAPEDLVVRWIAKRREMTDQNGNTIVVDVSIIADRNLPIGSIVWRGAIRDIPGTAEVPESGLYQVVTDASAPDIKGRNTRYEFGAMRYTDSLPALDES